MNKLRILGNWKDLAGKLKLKFAELSDDDVLYQEGKEEELLGKLQAKLGKTKEEVEDIIDKL
ncbi:MAG: CsbD family protein [Ignavibacteriaceae bacterium]|nr:CsbD family protein [Ignavibacteriaceae bacterium]